MFYFVNRTKECTIRYKALHKHTDTHKRRLQNPKKMTRDNLKLFKWSEYVEIFSQCDSVRMDVLMNIPVENAKQFVVRYEVFRQCLLFIISREKAKSGLSENIR